MPENLVSIERGAFQGCSALTTITLPDKLAYIGNAAFYDCRSLANITLSTIMPPQIGSENIFTGSNALTSLFVPAGAKANYDKSPWNAYDIVELTNIEEILHQENKTIDWPANVYNLDGRIVKYKATNLNQLPKGFYIVRGKKVMN